MIIVRLSGGMGNQMFEYALGRALSLENDVPLGLDLAFLLDRTKIPNFTFREYNLDPFNIKAKIVSKSEVPFLYRRHFGGYIMRYGDFIRRKLLNTPGKEKTKAFNPSILQTGPDVYLEGWWQSYKYFEKYAEEIRQDFTLKQPLPQKLLSIVEEMKSCNSVCVHIRRGDYINNKFHPVLMDEYYSTALSKISGTVDHIYVFDRDDIEWCKNNINFGYPTTFVENDCTMAQCLTLMRNCKHFIIANSSLSWWAAWLADNDKKIVVAPKKWFENSKVDTKDLIPESWIRI